MLGLCPDARVDRIRSGEGINRFYKAQPAPSIILDAVISGWVGELSLKDQVLIPIHSYHEFQSQ